MSTVEEVTKISDRAGTGAVNFSNGFNVNGSDSGISSFTHTEGANEPSSLTMGIHGGIAIMIYTKYI